MYVWEHFKNAGVVPCNERVRFNNMMGAKCTDTHMDDEGCDPEQKKCKRQRAMC